METTHMATSFMNVWNLDVCVDHVSDRLPFLIGCSRPTIAQGTDRPSSLNSRYNGKFREHWGPLESLSIRNYVNRQVPGEDQLTHETLSSTAIATSVELESSNLRLYMYVPISWSRTSISTMSPVVILSRALQLLMCNVGDLAMVSYQSGECCDEASLLLHSASTYNEQIITC